MMPYHLINGSAHRLPEIADKSVHMIACSPPYLGLRKYSGDQGVDWPALDYSPMPGLPPVHVEAIRCELGLEPDIFSYVGHLILCLREWHRILRDDGSLWLNIADSYSSGVNANLADCFQPIHKSDAMFFRNSFAVGITTHSINVSLNDKRFPYNEFFSLFGVERITIKQRNNDFCQVINFFADPGYAWISIPLARVSRNMTDLEIVIDEGYDISIIIPKLNFDGKPVVGVSIGALSIRNGNAPFSVKESAKPITEIVGDGQSIGDAVAFNFPLKCLPDINFVDKSISFPDGITGTVERVSDFRIVKASAQHFSLFSQQYRIAIHSTIVGHDFYLLNNGLFTPYAQLYGNAISLSNGRRAKQQMSVPERFKLAAQAEGWICRSAIVWAKGVSFLPHYAGSCMPESVQDRPTSGYEMVYMLAKQERYYYDYIAVQEYAREPGDLGLLRAKTFGDDDNVSWHAPSIRKRQAQGIDSRSAGATMRNLRDTWVINPVGYGGAHFACWPQALVEPMIRAGTSAHGVCNAPVKKLKVRSDLTPAELEKVNSFLAAKGWA
jgi:hypothetical protein